MHKEQQEKVEDEDDGAIIEDEDYDEFDLEEDDDDEEWDGSEDPYEMKDLYVSPLDPINEIMFFHEKMAGLQTGHKELYDYLCS